MKTIRGDWKCETWKCETVENASRENARHENARHDKAGKANARHENNASKAVMGSQMYKFGSLRQLCVKNKNSDI